MRVYLCLPLLGLTCNWLYAFTYAYNLAHTQRFGKTKSNDNRNNFYSSGIEQGVVHEKSFQKICIRHWI